MHETLNISTFLKRVYPDRISDYSHDYFLNDLFDLFIDDNNILDKNGEIYYFSRELSSKMFSNKASVPYAIKKKITKETFVSDKYIKNAEPIFNKTIGEPNIFSTINVLLNILNNDNSIDPHYKENINNLMNNKKYYSILWSLLCLTCLRNTKEEKKVKKTNTKVNTKIGFFYLSQIEKEKYAKSLITRLKNKNSHLNLNDFKKLLEILMCFKIIIPKEDKIIICSNILKNWKKEYGENARMCLIDYFEDARDTIKDNNNIYDEWINAIDKAYEIIMIIRIKEYYYLAMESDNYDILNNAYQSQILCDSFFYKNDYFLKALVDNKYFMPNYNENINQSLWNYCKNIAEFISKTPIKNKFICYISKNKEENIDNQTVVGRCDILISKCKDICVM